MKKDRESQFPYITDFTEKEEVYRNTPTNRLSYEKWFWHKPEAYLIIKYAPWLVLSINFSVMGLISDLIFNSRYPALISYILAILCFIGFVWSLRKLKEEIRTEVTFYDIWIRDNKEEDKQKCEK